jgi:GNAT superfamily N-acetyltransferase
MNLCTEVWLKILAKNGFQPTETSVAMAKPLAIEKTASQDILDIRTMNDALDQWMGPLIAYPATTAEINRQYKNRHAKALQRGKNLLHFSLFEHGQVISSLTLSLNKKLARIDDVATVPKFQKQGNASKLMKYALREAATLGANYCFLEASQQGLSIYKKLSFRVLFNNQIFNQLV